MTEPDWGAGFWLQTASGGRLDLLQPRPEDIDLVDVAHALGNLCRYAGHSRDFYSVAQHSVLVSETPEVADCRREALMHDAAEAFTGDCIRPLKRLLGADFASVEERVERAVAECFGLEFPWPPAVKVADNRLLATERRDLLWMPPGAWLDPGGEPLAEQLQPWHPRLAKYRFLERAVHLGIHHRRFGHGP